MKNPVTNKIGAFLLAVILSVTMLHAFPAGVRAEEFVPEDSTGITEDFAVAEDEALFEEEVSAATPDAAIPAEEDLPAESFDITPAEAFAIPGQVALDNVSIILHAGDCGYFEDPSIKAKESIQVAGGTFIDETIPDTDEENMIFLGWTTDPEGTEATVFSGRNSVASIGTDLYAVWTDEAHVYYFAQEGYYEKDGVEFGVIDMLYKIGDPLQLIEPKSYSEQLKFEGYYSGIKGKGTKYSAGDIIDQAWMELHAYWLPNMEKIQDMETDTEYHIDIESKSVLYRFVPDESTVYDIRTFNAVTDYTQAYIRLADEHGNRIEDGYTIGGANVKLSMELTEGTTYLLELSEYNGLSVSFDLKITKPEYVNVTFHTNLEPGEAGFDEDLGKLSKKIRIERGEEIHSFKNSGLSVADANVHTFLGWAVDPDAERPQDRLYADSDMDVYAVYEHFRHIVLDANGGYFTIPERSERHTISYNPGMVFGEQIDPHTDDPDLDFSGWATTPDAAVPDVFESISLCDELPDVVYAVYGEKMNVTYDANAKYGGFFVEDPDVSIYQTVNGKGHIFYGMTLMNNDSRMTPIGWRDHTGYEFFYMPKNPYYDILEDTTFTGVWGRKIAVFANGGYFFDLPEDPDDPDDQPIEGLTLVFRAEDPFTQTRIEELVGMPNPYDTNKYLAGFATSPDAEEPNVLEGETDVMGLTRIYAVWKDKQQVEKIKLDKNEAEVAAGKDLQLNAVLEPEGAAGTITWESSDPAIADVDENGIVTAKKYGSVTIKASIGDVSDSCLVSVLFKDVADHDKSYFDPVYWAVGKGITNVSVEFRPDDPVNRGEFTAFLYRLAGKPKVSKITDKFSDVKSDTKFAREITWAVNKGIIKGYSNGTFKPTANITRAQVAIMLWRYAGKPTVKVKKSPFPDVELNGSDTSNAIIWGYKNNIMKGSGGKFLPKDNCTRGQTVTFLYRYTTQ